MKGASCKLCYNYTIQCCNTMYSRPAGQLHLVALSYTVTKSRWWKSYWNPWPVFFFFFQIPSYTLPMSRYRCRKAGNGHWSKYKDWRSSNSEYLVLSVQTKIVTTTEFLCILVLPVDYISVMTSFLLILSSNELCWCSAVLCLFCIVSCNIFLGVEWNTWSSSSPVDDSSQEHQPVVHQGTWI